MSFKRYTLTDVTSNQFYQMPKFLFEGELKSNLSNDAKVLYSILKDRHELSLKNNWVNKNNEVYLIYTREDLCDMLGCSQPTLRKAIKQLKDNNLMDEERQGINKPNLIYLNYYELQTLEIQGLKESFSPECKNLSVQNENNFHSSMKENFIQECKNFSSNKTNSSHTDFSNTDNNHPIFSEQENCHDNDCDTEDIETLTEIIKENIGYEIAKQTQGETEYIDNILDIMLEVITSKSPTIRISGEEKSRALIKSIFMKLTYDHISYVCLCLSESTSKIKYIKQYLLTALYNAPKTMDIYYTQRVKHDMNLGG